MNKILFFLILVVMFCGCATNAHFVRDKNYDVGRSVDLCWYSPSKIIPLNQDQDKYLFERDNGCKWAYYVNKKTKIVESWEYISSPDKCQTGVGWFKPW